MPVRFLFFISTAVLILSLAACNKREAEGPQIDDFGYGYFPLEVGRSWEYELDSIIYDPAVGGTAVDSFRTYIREVIADTLLDNTGAVLYRVERYYRRSDTLSWLPERVLTLSRDEQRATRTEDNLRFTKLVFPVREGKSWNGNAYFDEFREVLVAGERVQMFKDWQYRILAAGIPDTIGGLEFDEVVTVQNADNRFFNNLLELRLATEQYARGVGLVYREAFIYDTECRYCCNVTPQVGGIYPSLPWQEKVGQKLQDRLSGLDLCEVLPWEEKVEKGFSLRQRLIRYQ